MVDHFWRAVFTRLLRGKQFGAIEADGEIEALFRFQDLILGIVFVDHEVAGDCIYLLKVVASE